MTRLEKLHEKLTSMYTDLLDDGCEDPRVLKEIREFLNDNNINATTINSKVVDSEVIELDVDSLAALVSNG